MAASLVGRAPRRQHEPPRATAAHRRRLVSVPPSLSPPLIPMPPRGGDLGLGAGAHRRRPVVLLLLLLDRFYYWGMRVSFLLVLYFFLGGLEVISAR